MPTCDSCGDHISHRWKRVHGDDRGKVHACPSCTSRRQRQNGAFRREWSDSRDTSWNTRQGLDDAQQQ